MKILSDAKKLVSLRSGIALLGYALYRAVAYNSYTTGFALADEQVGYIFNHTFLAAASVGLIGMALPLSIYHWHKPYKPLTIGYVPATAALLICYLFAWFAAPLLDKQLVMTLLGCAWGAATIIPTIAWLEILAHSSSPLVLIFQLTFASFLSAIIGIALPASLDLINNIFCCIFLIASILMLGYCRRVTTPYKPLVEKAATTDALRQALIPVVGCLLFEMVIGMINMYAVTAQTIYLVNASTPIYGMLICTVFTFLFVLVTTRLPNPSIVYLIVFPMMITFFLLLPFFGSGFGPQISQLFYAGYIFTTLIALLYYLRAGTAFRAGLYFIIFVVTGLTRVALVVGLSVGYLFGNLHQGNEAMQLTFIAVICAYLLGTAVVTWALRDARKAQKKTDKKEAEQASSLTNEPMIDGTQDKNTPTPEVDENATYADANAKPAHTVLNLEDALRVRIEDLSVRYHITPRERDVLVRLALGYSAAAIAEELVVATSTVNGYVKSIYTKLGVNRKQQVIDLFNDILVTPEPFKLIR